MAHMALMTIGWIRMTDRITDEVEVSTAMASLAIEDEDVATAETRAVESEDAATDEARLLLLTHSHASPPIPGYQTNSLPKPNKQKL
jgi:hypothetical protein